LQIKVESPAINKSEVNPEGKTAVILGTFQFHLYEKQNPQEFSVLSLTKKAEVIVSAGARNASRFII